MGQQIAIAQDKGDEDAAMDFLRARGDFFAVPRVQDKPKFEPVPAGACDDHRQILIPEAALEVVLATVQESGDDPGQFAVDFSVVSGMFIEWRRTRWLESCLVQAGRFYLARTQRPKSESIVTVTQAMTALQRFIRSKYPASTSGRYPIYVGPSMWERMKRGTVRILSSSGEEVDAVKNKN